MVGTTLICVVKWMPLAYSTLIKKAVKFPSVGIATAAVHAPGSTADGRALLCSEMCESAQLRARAQQ